MRGAAWRGHSLFERVKRAERATLIQSWGP